MTNKSTKARNIFLTIVSVSLIIFALLALRPLPKATLNNCIKYSGEVSEVIKGEGKGDIVVTLKNSNTQFYINRAIDNGYTVEALHEKLTGKTIEILAISHWTPLDPASKTKHIAEIRTANQVIYTEL